jgi:hypothetical protein
MKLPSFACDVYPARLLRLRRGPRTNPRFIEECSESMLCLELEPVPRREGKTDPTRSKGTSK